MLEVNYITRPWFLDIAAEFIGALKHRVKLNVVLIIAPKTVGYLGISEEEAPNYLNKIIPLDQVLRGEAYERFQYYFEGVTVTCKFEQHNETNYYNTLGWLKYLAANPRFLKADLNIVESLSLADWYLLLRIRNKRIFYIIHDPVPHTGEGRTREENINRIYFPYINKFITYSQTSAALFSLHYQKYKEKLLTLKMPIYNSQKLSKADDPKDKRRKKIVLFGRISPYKGAELFYEAATRLASNYPQVDFIIAGRVIEGYHPSFIENNTQQNIIIKNDFITLAELNTIMQDAELCVVPYTDATQSGVIMTSYAFDLPVLVSDCEGLLEYCFDRQNFSFVSQNLQDLIEKLEFLINHPELIEIYKQKINEYRQQEISIVNCNLVLDHIHP